MEDKKYDPSKVNIVLRGPNGREYKMHPMKEKDMSIKILASIEPKCCGCGEGDHNKLDTMTITMPYKKVTLKPKIFICYDCIEKIKKKKSNE